jgi:hypothetical protein
MTSLHYIEITFPEPQPPKSRHSELRSVLRTSLILPQISKRPDTRVKPSRLEPDKESNTDSADKAESIVHLSSVSSKMCDRKAGSKIFVKKPSFESPKHYMQFYAKIEKEKLKRLANSKKSKTQKRDNLWRYNISAKNSVFDVTQLAENIFHHKFS